MTDFEFIKRHHVLSTPNYWFEIDEYKRGDDQFLLAHIRFAKFSPSIYREILRNWKIFRQCVTAPLFAVSELDDPKWEKFVTRLGFQPVNEVVCENGERRRLFLNI